MHETIDELFKKKKSSIYTNLSLIFGVVSLLIYANMMGYLSGVVKPQNSFLHPPIFLIRLFYLSLILGVILTIMCFVKKERFTWKRWLGLFINVSLFLIYIGSMAFFYYIEFTK